jgi:hypothetical protein
MKELSAGESKLVTCDKSKNCSSYVPCNHNLIICDCGSHKVTSCSVQLKEN